MDRMAGNLKKVMLIAAVLAGLLVCRLFYIQITGNGELAAVTRMQSMIALEGGNTRGIIYDRNGSPLVADEKRFVYIIKKKKICGKRAWRRYRKSEGNEKLQRQACSRV